ncbi:MAG: DUF1853 family protein [Psychroflexus halocasei]
MQTILQQYKAFFETPLLIRNPDMLEHIGIFDFDKKQISQPDKEDLKSFQKLGFIGKRAELFAKFVLENSSDYELISHSLQIFDDKKTLGEFDFIFKDLKSSEIVHLEMVYKVYLFDSRLSENPDLCWIGPNRKDSFHEKHEKLMQHQFPLLYHPKTAKELTHLNIDSVNSIKQKLLFKTILFKKYQEKLPQSEFLNTHQISGFWLHFEEFLTDEWRDATYFKPDKVNWFNAIENVSWESYQDIKTQVEAEHAINRNPMLWVKKNRQILKIFVVQTDF